MWLEVGSARDVEKRRKVVVDHNGTPIVVIAHEGRFYALDNICIHKQRELVRGVVLNGRIVCPGHQWAFELGSGWEQVKQQCQPVYDVRVDDGIVLVDTESRRTPVQAPVDPAGAVDPAGTGVADDEADDPAGAVQAEDPGPLLA